MYMDSMSFDSVDMKAMVIRQIRYAEPHQGARWAAVRRVADAPTGGFRSGLAQWGGGLLAGWVKKHADWVDDKTVQLEGLTQRLRKAVIECAVYPDDRDLLRSLDKLKGQIDEIQRSIGPAADTMLKRNERSRVGLALVKLVRSYDAMAAATGMLRQIVTRTDWETELGVQRTRFNAVRSKIRSNDTSDIDEDLLALADEAIASSAGRDLSTDADWPNRMVGTVH
jgi:hypothetical protein